MPRCLGPLAGLSPASLDELESLTAVRDSPAPQVKPPTKKAGKAAAGSAAAGGSGSAAGEAAAAAAAASAVVAAPAAAPAVPPPPPLVPDAWYELAAPTLEALGLVCAVLQTVGGGEGGAGGGGEAPGTAMSDGPPPVAAATPPPAATAVEQLSSGAALAAALSPSGGGAPLAEGWEVALPPPFLALSVPFPLPLAQRVAAWHAETGRDALDRRPREPAAAPRTAEEARPDALESSPLPEDARRSLLLAALLAPLATLGLRRSSGRPEPLAAAVVVECLKRRVSDGDAVASLLAGATALRALVRALAQGAASPPGATLSPLASADAFALCRAELARILRGVGKEQWPLSLLLAAALDAAPALFPAAASAPPGPGELAAALWPVLGTYAHLGRLVHAWSLDGAWARRHVIEGRRMMAEMPGVAGPALGRVMDEQMRWQLLHPGAGEAEILAHLRGFAARVPAPASEATASGAAASAASGAGC